MQVQHLFIISFSQGSGGEHKPPKKSAKGLFYKYCDMPGIDSVTWYHVGWDQKAQVRAKWERANTEDHQALRDRGLLRDADQAPAAKERKPDAGGAGAYIVAHAAQCQVAGINAFSLAQKLSSIKALPPLRKIEFIACHAANFDQEAHDNPVMRDIRLASDEDEAEPGRWVHGLDVEELSFISQFCCCYAESLEDPRDLKVAGWDCFVSVAHPKKDPKDMPANFEPSMTGKKFIRQGGPPTFPSKPRHYKAKKMFRWQVTGEKRSTVAPITRAEWSDKLGK
ncbi:MAG: hypothetical protein JO251_08660 [Verrucomicrobia bacterium]|nr:hypothetical protein [Verrucomicrobiota bacterium]MBV8641483.1 hypothetical protein [Verrucomicrobiota bacterium]